MLRKVQEEINILVENYKDTVLLVKSAKVLETTTLHVLYISLPI